MLTSQYDESVVSEDVERKIQCITPSVLLGYSRLDAAVDWLPEHGSGVIKKQIHYKLGH